MPGLWGEDMAVKRVQSDIDVVTAAKKRIKNVFSNGLTVYMSFSGGKDSLCLAHLVLDDYGRRDKRQATCCHLHRRRSDIPLHRGSSQDMAKEISHGWRALSLVLPRGKTFFLL